MAVIHSLYREAGVVKIDESMCRRCGQCAQICPAEVLHLVDGHVRINENSRFGCIACGHCMMTCPEGSISVTGRGISPEDLRSLPPKEQKATSDALAALMFSRRSIRRFKDQEVDPQALAQIAEMAASAPMGIPPWDIGCISIRGKDRIQEIAAEIIKGYEGFLKIFKPFVLSAMRPFVGRETYEQYRHFIRPLAETYVAAHRQGRDVLFYDAPALMIFHHSPYADHVDAAIACTYAMLAAESLGLGSTIIGGAPPILQRNKPLSRSLGIPEGNTASLSLILGHPAADFKRAVRRKFSFVNVIG